MRYNEFSDQNSRFDPDFAKLVAETTGPNATTRHEHIITSFIRHVHDFARDVKLTHDEWMTGVDYINSLGQHFTAKSHEAFRLRDMLGLGSLVEEIENKTIPCGSSNSTSSAVLGPLWAPDAPFRENGASIIHGSVPTARGQDARQGFGSRHGHTDIRGNCCWVLARCFAPQSDNIRKTMSATCPMLIAEITCTDHASFCLNDRVSTLKTYGTLLLIIFEIPCNLLWKLIGSGWFLPLSDVLFGMASIGTVFMRLKKP
ncbi:Catechol 1,2-dioxygenase [Metarhizium brunneum]|uniref:Catechol 1,2-dioxygenase n=1 Tax=Metarhizium brunneum TaxID=500148 RepID=A0A7D5URB0_9HYPO